MKLTIAFTQEIKPQDLQGWMARSGPDLLHNLYTSMLNAQKIAIKFGVERDAQAVEATRPPMLDLFGADHE